MHTFPYWFFSAQYEKCNLKLQIAVKYDGKCLLTNKFDKGKIAIDSVKVIHHTIGHKALKT